VALMMTTPSWRIHLVVALLMTMMAMAWSCRWMVARIEHEAKRERLDWATALVAAVDHPSWRCCCIDDRVQSESVLDSESERASE